MESKRELAEARIDKMGFDEREKAVIFYDWPEGDEHILFVVGMPIAWVLEKLGILEA